MTLIGVWLNLIAITFTEMDVVYANRFEFYTLSENNARSYLCLFKSVFNDHEMVPSKVYPFNVEK